MEERERKSWKLPILEGKAHKIDEVELNWNRNWKN